MQDERAIPADTVAIILARGGSRGIPDKNLQPVGGVSLVGRAIRAARAAAGVGSVHVSTDSPRIAAEARLFEAHVVTRPADLSGDTATSESGWLHALDTIRADRAALGQPEPALAVFLQCTSPFTTGADIDATLAALRDQAADCALSVLADHGFLWHLNADGSGQGTNHDHTAQRARRQDLPPSFRESGAIYAVRVPAFRAVGRRFCGRVALHPVDHPAVEIDTPADLHLCSLLAARPDHAGIDPARLSAVRALVMDFDGVHTDDLAHVTQDGVESVRVSRSDGMGLGLLRARGGLAMLILSKERNPVVTARGAKLGIEVLQGIDDKVAALSAWLADRGLGWDAVLFVGNDINDAPAMGRAGLSACPADAHPSILVSADWVLPRPGGQGALRALADTLLATPSAP
jgi:YrbI family 3-deoxy-D-manno-octulosonate 8-phosphate phosphatase